MLHAAASISATRWLPSAEQHGRQRRLLQRALLQVESAAAASSSCATFHFFWLLLTPRPRRARADVPQNASTSLPWEASLASHSEAELPTGVDSTGLRRTTGQQL